ncbi:MAG: SDR family NAD(P)-dependent oxidoreductase [Pseudomonadota bacterium]
MSFEGKTALVTGASRGMGAATARLLADKGARVFTAQRGAAGFEDIGADLTDADAPGRVIEEVQAHAGRLDILINNAGIMREGYADQMAIADWHDQIAVNLTAPFLFIRHALPLLKAAKGAIVNVGSIEGIGNNPMHSAYGASKAGLHGLTRAIAVDHGPDGVRCNAVAPGWIDTDLNEEYISAMPDPDAFRAEIGGIHPLRRTGAPEEVAKLICWLASDDASFVTGQIWTIDGGRMAQLSLP